MNSLSSAPFARILPAFCFGIICSFYNIISYFFAIIIFTSGITGYCYFTYAKSAGYAFRRYSGFFLQLIYLIIGFALMEIKDERNSELYFSKLTCTKYYIASLDDSPDGHNGRLRAEVSMVSGIKNDSTIPVIGHCYLYFKNDSNAVKLKTGDKIIFNGLPALIAAPQNPGQFDFKYRSAIHRIYYQVFLNPGNWKQIITDDGFNLHRFSSELRDKFLNKYREAGLNGQEFAVLSALVLGYKDEIDTETMKAFSASGTMHVLSVSGMHVGIIFTAMSALLSFLKRRRSTRVLRLYLLLTALWFYALLTGLSPSVIRSAMMLSFILIGRSMNRSSNIYNSLSLSALCIFILFDPLILFEAGLQLSFLAVGGIALLYPEINGIMFFKNKLAGKIWGLISVSIAAQAATFAISIYYFHQFPNYFILANIIIIPISTVSIFSGIVLLLISPFPFLSMKAGWLVHQVISLLNASALFIENLPGSVWNGISINLMELVLIYAIIFSVISFFRKRAIMNLYKIEIFSIALFCLFIFENYRSTHRKEILIFSSTSCFTCQINVGFNSFLLYHSIDSAGVINYSNSYCLSENIPLNKRILICLDDTTIYHDYKRLFISDNYILFDNYLILDLSDYKKSRNVLKDIKPAIVYINKSTFKYNRPVNFYSGEIVLNDRNIQDSLITKINKMNVDVHLLSKAAFNVKL